MSDLCVVCKSELKSKEAKLDVAHCECPSCGRYSLTDEGRVYIEAEVEKVGNGRAKLRNALCKLTRSQPWARIDAELAKDLLLNTKLPNPGEMLDNLILLIGTAQPTLGGYY